MSSSAKKRENALGSRSDPGWEHGIEVFNTAKRVKCKYCGVVRSGDIFRLKHHLAGTHSNVEACLQAPDDVKEKFRAILYQIEHEAAKKKKKLSDMGDDDYYCEVNQEQASNQKGKGPIDSFVSAKKGSIQTTLNQKYKREEREEVCQQIARFFYTSAIPFNAANNPEFTLMVEKIAKYGIGLKPPSYHELRVTYLNKEVDYVMDMLEEFKAEWKHTGCTIMSDGWSDRQRRSICNFLVNSPKGTVFLSSVDTSDISKTADKVFDMLDAVVENVGEENVVQIVTDNAANYKAAGEMLMEKRSKLFWTPCAAHCIDLMLEDLDKKIKVHSLTISKAKKITTFIYARTMVHAWLKEFTKGRELIRPGVTRFATSYLTLRSLNEQKGPLLAMFASSKWRLSKFASSMEGKKVQRIAMDTRGFWHGVITCLKAALPLVKVLRMVDSDDPAMGFIYKAMEQAKTQIKENFNNVEKNYKPVLDIVDERWEAQLHRPLHVAAYYLNPQIHYKPDFKPNADIKIGLYACLQRMIHDPEERVVIDLQIDTFHNARGLFGLPTAVMTRDKKSPADWWDSYGDECPELKKFAIRILSLTCSSFGCERNWSAFEMVHTKKRNRLHQQKMNDLVFVMYNLKLRQKHQKRAVNYQPPIVASNLLNDFPSDDEWITEIEEPVLQEDGPWLNVLDRAARRAAREEQRMDENNDEEIRPSPNVNVEQLEISDDDDVAACVASNEVGGLGNLETDFDDGDGDDDDVYICNNDAVPMGTGTGTSGMGSFDYVNDGNFGYNED